MIPKPYFGKITVDMITDSSQSKLKNIVSTIQQEQNDVIRKLKKQNSTY